MSASVNLEFAAPAPDTIAVSLSVRLDEAHAWKETRSLTIERLTARE